VADMGCRAGGGHGRAPKARGSRRREGMDVVKGFVPIPHPPKIFFSLTSELKMARFAAFWDANFADCSNLKLYLLLFFCYIYDCLLVLLTYHIIC